MKMASLKAMLVAGTMMATAMMSGAQPVQAQDWPSQQITFVVALGPGGSADRAMRLLAQRFQEELGVPVRVVNQEGGGGHVGQTYFMNMPTDGTVFLASSIHPYVSNAILDLDADYTLDDFAFINGQWTDKDLFAVYHELPYTTIDELMEAVRSDPGKIRVSVVPGSTGFINTLQLLEAYDLEADDVNIVTYESGGAARTAAAGGQVDMTVLGADGTLPIAEYVRPLAVASDTPLPDWDAPVLNEAIASTGKSITPLVGSMRGIAAHAEFRDNHPEAFAKMVATYESILADPEFAQLLADQQIGAEWLGPERTTEIIKENFKILQQFQSHQ
ncbi:Tripartite tricarboxylate transporter family receptor [Paracoccus haematequi]|uniref:Tripartite tricarboxylate transporter family receptor n=2 Tax=Paracoccus haematequi TaxID=2491866 RepID=A0A3S4CM46_9RHOB|nr:Tripartite tricarboxylate transporter family receptor [Paracoccus haematequi]